MKRITAVFPSRAEAETAYNSLKSLNLAQEAMTLLADSSRQVNPNADDSRSSEAPEIQMANVPLIIPVGSIGGSGMGTMGGILPANAVSAAVSGTENDLDTSRQTVLNISDKPSSKPVTSATLESFQAAGFSAEEAQYYSSVVSQGHAVLSVELNSDVQEASVRQIISQNDGHPFAGISQ